MKYLTLISTLVLILIAAASASAQTFSDDFSSGKLDTTKWKIGAYQSPGSEPRNNNNGTYSPSMLDFSQGMLRIRLDQKWENKVCISTGGLIQSVDKFGYGTYEFVMRQTTTSATPNGQGKTLSGAVSSGFVYNTNSESEIDLEFLGNENSIHITTWHNTNPAQPPSGSVNVSNAVKNKFLGTQFRTYKLVWLPTSVKVYIDGVLVVSHSTHIPSAPAHIILQHRGTNTNSWGGVATTSVTRYFYVKSVKFTAMVP